MTGRGDATMVLVFSDRLTIDRHPVWHDWGRHTITNDGDMSTARTWTACGRLAWERTWSESTMVASVDRVVMMRRDTARTIGPRCGTCERKNPE